MLKQAGMDHPRPPPPLPQQLFGRVTSSLISVLLPGATADPKTAPSTERSSSSNKDQDRKIKENHQVCLDLSPVITLATEL